MSDASRPAKRARRTPAPPTTTKPRASRTSSKQNGVSTSTTTTTADAEEEEDRPATPLPYVPNRAIPPIAPTPPAECPPLPQGRRARIVSRRYDPETMQPLYRVRIEPRGHGVSPGAAAAADEHEDEDRAWVRRAQAADGAHGRDGVNGGEGTAAAAEGDDAEEHTAPLSDILSWVSPAELERFELEWEDDVVVMVDEDGAVLLVSKEAQRAMMGWPSEQQQPAPVAAPAPAAGAGAAGEPGALPAVAPGNMKMIKKRRKKKPMKEFVDMLPPRRRVGRPRKGIKTAEVMGVVGGDTENYAEELEEASVDTASETAEYGEWVNPANVRGMAPESVMPDRADERDDGANERDELALSEASEDEDPLGKWMAGRGTLLTERPSGSPGGGRRSVRSTTSSRGSSRADVAQRGKARSNGSRRASEAPSPASPVRRSISSRGAGLRRSSMSSNNSAAHSFRTAESRRPSMRSSATPSRSSSGVAAENGAASLLSAFNSTQEPSSRRQGEEKNRPNANPAFSPRAMKSPATNKDSKRRRTSTTVPTTSALHQASSMLHPPAEGSSWEPEVEEEEEEEEYEIESIIRDQLFGSKSYYLVKWANWPPDEQSWFTEEELEGAREVLDAYLERVRGKKTKKKKGSRKGKERAMQDERGWNEGGDVEM